MGRPMLPAPWWTCEECGAGFQRKRDGKTPRYCGMACSGRANKRKARDMRGPANPRYNGGLCFHRGRWLISCRDGSTMQFARGVMCAEFGRILRPEEIVHHIDGDPTHDAAANLIVVTRAQHIDLHRADRAAA